MAKTMAVTVLSRTSVGGTMYQYIGSFKPDSEYGGSGGDTLTNPSEGIKLPSKIQFMQVSGGGGGYHPQYTPSTGKVKVFTGEATGSGAGGKEVADKVDLSAQVFPFICWGS